jgi:hypothetical protein
MTTPHERAMLDLMADLVPASAIPANEANLGPGVPLYQRFMRALAGNPVFYGSAVSTGPADPHGLADYPDVRQAVLYVAGGDILYRVDGGLPNPAGDQTVQQRSTIILTGQPSVKAFQFAAAVAGNVTVFFTYYN